MAGDGGMTRDANENWIFGFSRNIGVCDAIEAELWGILDGLTIAWSWRLQKIIIESDCQGALDWINKGSDQGCTNTLVEDILRLLDKQWSVQLRHVHREANQVADFLAKRHSHNHKGIVILTGSSPDIEHLLLQDMAHVATSRQNASSL